MSPGLMEGWAASSPELVGTCLPQFAAFLGTALRAGGQRHHNLMDRAMMVKKPPITGETALQRLFITSFFRVFWVFPDSALLIQLNLHIKPSVVICRVWSSWCIQTGLLFIAKCCGPSENEVKNLPLHGVTFSFPAWFHLHFSSIYCGLT